MRFLIYFLALFLAFSNPAFAGKQADELKTVEANLKKQRAEQKELADTQAVLQEKLDDVRQSLIKAAEEVQLHERALQKLQDQRKKTEEEIETIKTELDSQRKSLADIIMALQRLNRMPPQALLARPSAPIDMARSFGLLQKIIPAVSEKAQEIKTTYLHLQELHDVQDKQEKDLLAERTKMNKRQAKLETLVKQRQALLAKNEGLQKEAARKVNQLAQRASTLKDLMEKIVRQAPVPVPVYEAPKVVDKVKTWLGSVVSSLGSARLPVTGRIATGYGQTIEGGSRSQGMSISADAGTIVVAPTAGTIRFAGPFRQYKLLVIIQHPNGEHSLLGGMQELYTRTGARVSAGEPLGKLPGKMTGDSKTATSLYYERRRNGKPIDPRQARG